MSPIKRVVAALAVALSAVLMPLAGSLISPAAAMACPWGPPGPCLCPPGVHC